jgi:hypothetical protein
MIPGFIITWLTFPGVIVHELAHKLFCQWTGTKVLQVCYFRFGNPAGFVVHEKPASVWRHILIGIGPLFVNTSFGLILAMVAIVFGKMVERSTNVFLGSIDLIMFYLAVSIAMHSFPSTGDAKSIWATVSAKDAPMSARLVGTPLVGLIYLGALGSIFWLDLLYGFGVVYGIPYLLHMIE